MLGIIFVRGTFDGAAPCPEVFKSCVGLAHAMGLCLQRSSDLFFSLCQSDGTSVVSGILVQYGAGSVYTAGFFAQALHWWLLGLDPDNLGYLHLLAAQLCAHTLLTACNC